MPDYAAPDGTRLHFTDEGAGIPLIALPGLTRSGRDFDFLAPHLTGVRLIRPDYRGRGQSDWADPATYTVPVEAGDVLALMDHLHLDAAAVLGTSRGGLIAMTMGVAARERLTGVAFNDIGPVIEPAGLDVIKGYLGIAPTARTLEEAAAARKAGLTGFHDVPDSRWLEEAERFYEVTGDRLALRYDARLRETVLGGGVQPAPDLWPLFDALDGLPLCLIRGETSDLLSRATADEMARRRPDMIRTEVPGRGHVPYLDEPESLAALNAWIELL